MMTVTLNRESRTSRPDGDTVTVTDTELPVIELVHPMPGFPDLHKFALVQLDDAGRLSSLTSLEQPDLRFLVAPPAPFFPDYEPEVDDEVVSELGIEQVEDVLLLVVLNAGASLAETTANLAAPVLVNTVTRRAAQVILDGPGLPVAAPLIA
jgi:flagellar assembly factor FliW